MDELLERHAQQLREIDERLEMANKQLIGGYHISAHQAIKILRLDLARMIDVAQAESDAF